MCRFQKDILFIKKKMICRSPESCDNMKSNECIVIKYRVNKGDGVNGNTYSGICNT